MRSSGAEADVDTGAEADVVASVSGDPPIADHRRHTPALAYLLNEVIHVAGLAAIDQQLSKRITPASEQLQRRTGQSISHQPMRPGLDIGIHIARPAFDSTRAVFNSAVKFSSICR